MSISPTEGSTAGATRVIIALHRPPGIGFQSGDTVTVDGSRVDATVLNGNAISLAMPAHAAGKVDVTVIRQLSQTQESVPGGYTYVAIPPPVISELVPNIGSTGGGTPLIIRGTGFRLGLTVTFDGVVRTLSYDDWDQDFIYILTPAHAAGTVDVIVTNSDGQAASGVFTYVSPATFDFNGNWKGYAENLGRSAHLELTIRDNIVVSVSCGERHDGTGASSMTLDPPPVVAKGEFSFAGSGGDSITGNIVSPNSAFGSINMASCISMGQWRVERK